MKTATPTNSEEFQYGFLKKWILVNSAGCILALPVAIIAGHFVNGLVIALLVGGLIGFAQWLVLRERLTVNGWWVVASAVGLGAAFLISVVASQFEFLSMITRGSGSKIFGSLTFGLLAGLLVGVLQMPLLARRFARTGWWILFNAIGWGLCASVGSSIDGLITVVSSGISGHSNVVVVVVTGLTAFVGGLLFSIPLGAVTGCGLLWMAKHPTHASHARA
jgi:hypothetical protein